MSMSKEDGDPRVEADAKTRTAPPSPWRPLPSLQAPFTTHPRMTTPELSLVSARIDTPTPADGSNTQSTKVAEDCRERVTHESPRFEGLSLLPSTVKLANVTRMNETLARSACRKPEVQPTRVRS